MHHLNFNIAKFIAVLVLAFTAFAITPTADAFACVEVVDLAQSDGLSAHSIQDDQGDQEQGPHSPCIHGHCHHSGVRPSYGWVSENPVYGRNILTPAAPAAEASVEPDGLKRPPRI